MNRQRFMWLLVTGVFAAVMVAACGGGGGSTTPAPPSLNPNDKTPPGGDPRDVTPPGLTPGAFTIAGGFTDLRGVAASQQYVYVASATAVYCFDKLGNLVNMAVAPSTIQALAVLPPTPSVENVDMESYYFAGFPVILYNPVRDIGYVRIYAPNLDTFTTREDVTNPDAVKYIDLPGPIMDPPNTDALFQCLLVYDMAVDRFGSIFVTMDFDIKRTIPRPDFHRAVQVFNQFKGYALQLGGTAQIQDDQGNTQNVTPPVFDDEFMGEATGDLGSIGFDSFFPFNRTDLTFTWYTGDYTLLRDYVGISTVTLNPFTEEYTFGQRVNNPLGYFRVIGEGAGNAPGSFAQNPPRDPAGNLEDVDLSEGGPSGISTDPMTDNVYICDPGNRRVQVFKPGTGDFDRQIGDGTRGRAGSQFLAPNSASLDYEGNVYICDVNDLRVLREKQPGVHFGNIGGTVRRIDNATPLEGATVSLGNELGTIALRSTNIIGEYLINYLKTGTYYMTATKFGFDPDTAQVQILNDTTVRADFNLTPHTPAVVGGYKGAIIDDATNLDLPNVLVEIIGTSLTATTDSIGGFLITNITPGTYQVRFSLAGYTTITRDVEIVAGSVTVDTLIKMVPLPAGP